MPCRPSRRKDRVGAGVEAVVEKVVDGHLDGAHVDAARQPQVGIEQIAVAIFFRRPAAQPPGPGTLVVPVKSSARLLSERNSWKRLFGDHVGDENDQDLIRQCHPGSTVAAPAPPILAGEVGQVIGRLPGPLDRQEQGEVFPDERFESAQDFPLRGDSIGFYQKSASNPHMFSIS